jgi:Amt family ammonium transporter
MREVGCKFALDDFGSGFSSFAYLRFLPVDYLKIDGAFIQNIHHDLVNQTMVRSMNDVAHAMGVETIAEFVESAEILDVLRRLGVDYAQGYHVGRPAPAPLSPGAHLELTATSS